LKTLGIPGELLKIAPIAVVGFDETDVAASCFRFMFISHSSLSSWQHDQECVRSLSDGDCSELLTKLLRGPAAKTAQAIVI
jgi:hypothetical protein